MITPERQPECSARAYGALLLLYPKRFRLRFGPEMQQIFKDCCRMYVESSSYTGILTLWLRTVTDLGYSLLREWHRETIREDSEVDFTGLADAVMITVVVGALLLGWGWIGTVYAFDFNLRHRLYSGSALTSEEIVLAGIVMVVTAILVGVLSAIVVARNGRVKYHRIKV